MKMILLIAGLMMTQFLILDTDDFDAFLNRVDKRDIETEAILCCAASETFLKQHPSFSGTLNTEIKLVDGNIVFHNFRDYMTGQKEETFRFPSTNIKAQLELKRYNNLKALQSIDAERKRLETKRRILILSDFRLDSGSPKETVLKLYPMEKRLVTQAAAMLKYESNGYLLDLWGDQLRDIQEIPSNK